MGERLKTQTDAKRLGARMRSARKAANFTLKYVARQTGVDPGQLSKLERGDMRTLSKNVLKICTFLGISVVARVVPPTRAGQMLDELIADLPISEAAVTKLLAAMEEIVRAAARPKPSQKN